MRAPYDPAEQSSSGQSSSGQSSSEHDDTTTLIRLYRDTHDRRIRNQIVEANLAVVDHFVRRFARTGRFSEDDFRQVAFMALIGAVERFNPDVGASLRTFAARTIEGELKRFMRDRSWMVRPPRSHQETHIRVRTASEALTQELRRTPTVRELADFLETDLDTVLSGLTASRGRDYDSLNRPVRNEDGSLTEQDFGDPDPGFELAEIRMAIRSGMAELSEQERLVLRMRFMGELTQLEIAEEIGVSQSYVSRMIRTALSSLRSNAELQSVNSDQSVNTDQRINGG